MLLYIAFILLHQIHTQSIYVEVADQLNAGIDPSVVNDFANTIPIKDKRRPRSELMMSNYTPELRIIGMQMQGVRSYEQHLMNDLVNKFRRRSSAGRRYRHGR